MKFSILIRVIFIGVLLSIMFIAGCSVERSEPKTVKSTPEHEILVPINTKSAFSFSNIRSKTENTISTVKSSDGLAVIEKKENYYNVVLDLEKGSHYNVGKAYGEAILEINPDYSGVIEPYLYENIISVFGALNEDYTTIKERLDKIIPQIPGDYIEEMKGFADAVATGDTAFAMDEKLSREEVYLLSLVPDVLRGTQCSGIAVFGDKSQTGSAITGRILEWNPGNEKQLASAHAVVTFKNFDKTITTVGFLGILDVISAVNDDGVFLAILDSSTGEPFVIDNRKSYSFEIRYALENYSTAKDVAQYTNALSKQYTFLHNLLITDKNSAMVAENCVSAGKAGIRTTQSRLVNGLKWENKDSLCVVNGFALENSFDNLTGTPHNAIRWQKFDERLRKYDRVSSSDIKDILTEDDPNEIGYNLYSSYTIQTIIYDSASGMLEVAFTPRTDKVPTKPVFTKIF